MRPYSYTREDIDRLLFIYFTALKSRFLEEKCERYYDELTRKRGDGVVRAHFSGIGAETSAATIVSLLRKEDWIVPRYRGFATLLAKGVSPERILAEKLGKKTGFAQGIGGTSSYYDPVNGIMGHSTVLGFNFSLAIGLALAKKYRKEPGIIALFFGEGEASRNTFGGALNAAALWSLPILFICENNGIAVRTHFSKISSTATVSERAGGYEIMRRTFHEFRPLSIYRGAKAAITYVRENRKPYLLEILQPPPLRHSSRESVGTVFEERVPAHNDSLRVLERSLEQLGIPAEKLASLRSSAVSEVRDAALRAEAAEVLTPGEFMNIYHE